ncbi:hypothetical protein MHBO_000746 [Bonamia ostreae]|uniref:Iron hydrogenase large subunit C-terminal domain-containing protein n=1 Tax=Bonamia ostreae TaxID=126728 RepID=A0ABV2AGQ3_9EUKA
MENFSTGIKIADINDYVNLETDCIFDESKESPKNKSIKISQKNLVSIKSQSKAKSHFNQIRTNPKTKNAKITLEDCLACSGCVTSAETVLIEQQDTAQFVKMAKNIQKDHIFIVTISTQSIVSIANKLKIKPEEAFNKIRDILIRNYNVSIVVDSATGNYLALKESIVEFLKRLEQNENLPILSSECPGWVCYAEKTLGKSVIPLMSKVKSAQATMGSLIKRHFSENFNPQKMLHVAVMPCPDKKLESSRSQLAFTQNGNKIREVDCVLTTTELFDLLNFENFVNNSQNLDFKRNLKTENFKILKSNFNGRINEKSSSGGYIQNIIDYFVASENSVVKQQNISADFKIVTVTTKKFGDINLIYAYGFRNISKISRQIKSNYFGDKKVHLIEIMACPSGCLNGGGQLRPESKGVRFQKELVSELYSDFNAIKIIDDNFSKDLDFMYKALKRKKEFFKTDFNDNTPKQESLSW